MQKYVDRKSVSQHEIFASGPLHRVQTHTANTQHTHLSNKMHIYVAFVARTISMLHFALSRVARCVCAMLRADPFLASQRPRHTVFRADAFCHRVCCRQRPRVHIELRSNHRMYIIWKWLGSCIGGASRILATKYILIYCVASPTWRRIFVKREDVCSVFLMRRPIHERAYMLRISHIHIRYAAQSRTYVTGAPRCNMEIFQNTIYATWPRSAMSGWKQMHLYIGRR